MNKFSLNIDALYESLYWGLEDILGFSHKGTVEGYYKKEEAARAIAMALIPLIEAHLKPVQD